MLLAREPSIQRSNFVATTSRVTTFPMPRRPRPGGQPGPPMGNGLQYRYNFVTSHADWAIGDYMTEAIFPVMLHQDPRYFRKGTGSGFQRLAYAVSQIFWTHT